MIRGRNSWRKSGSPFFCDKQLDSGQHLWKVPALGIPVNGWSGWERGWEQLGYPYSQPKMRSQLELWIDFRIEFPNHMTELYRYIFHVFIRFWGSDLCFLLSCCSQGLHGSFLSLIQAPISCCPYLLVWPQFVVTFFAEPNSNIAEVDDLKLKPKGGSPKPWPLRIPSSIKDVVRHVTWTIRTMLDKKWLSTMQNQREST